MSDEPHRPTNPEDKDGWRAYWTALGMPWRTEPEIDEERQRYLAERRAFVPNVEQGVYAFRDIKLTRADVEWLLVTHESGGMRGPVALDDESQSERIGLDLRGAVLNRVDLSNLPLARTLGGLAVGPWWFDGYHRYVLPGAGRWLDDLLARLETACLRLADANLLGAHLEGAMLRGVHLERAHLSKANLQGADLVAAHLNEAELYGAHLEGVWLADAHLENARFSELGKVYDSHEGPHLERAWAVRAHFEQAQLVSAHLEGATLSEARFRGAFMQSIHGEGMWAFRAHFERAYFNDAHLEGAWLAESNFRDAILSNAHLERATLGATRMERANLDDAQLAGSWFNEAHLEGANLTDAHCEGKQMPVEDVERIRKWEPRIQATIPAANFTGAFFDASTNLRGIVLSKPEGEGVWLADARWRDANLSLVSWGQMRMLGEEYEANQSVTEEGQAKAKESGNTQYETAVRTYRQMGAALRSQGLNEHADRFSYRAHRVQRTLFWRQRKIGRWLWSWFLELLAGYGYEPIRTVGMYLGVVFAFASVYLQLAPHAHLRLSFIGALVMSVASFHGRGFFPTPSLALDNPLSVVGAFEAMLGLVIEASFVATFVQRFFAR